MSERIISNKKEFDFFNILKKSKYFILAIQHLLAMFGATVLVPILTGFDVSVALVCAGIGTLSFHFITKNKVPVFLGSSFAFIPVIIAVREQFGDLAYAQGGIIASGVSYIAMSLLVKKFGVEKIKSLFPDYIVGSMIIVIGLNLVPVAFNMASSNFLVASVTLFSAILISRFANGFLKQLSIIISIFLGYFVAFRIGLVDLTSVKEANIFIMPSFRAPKFDLAAILMIAPVVLAVFMEHIGDITTNGMVVSKNFLKDPGLNKTLLGDGVATMIAGFLGGPANTTYGENTGVLAVTKNYNPKILRIAALFAIILGFVGKLGSLIQTIPVCVMGGISLMLFSMISLVGFKTLKNTKDKYDYKKYIIMFVIIFVGLIAPNTKQYLNMDIAIKITNEISLSGLSLASLLGVILNKILNK